MEFSRPEYWSGKLFPSPGDLPKTGIESRSSTLQADSLPTEPQGKPKNIGVGSLSLLQGIFPKQGLNPGLPHCRQILYQLSHKGSPRILEWVAYPFFRGSSWPFLQGSPALQADSLPTELSGNYCQCSHSSQDCFLSTIYSLTTPISLRSLPSSYISLSCTEYWILLLEKIILYNNMLLSFQIHSCQKLKKINGSM